VRPALDRLRRAVERAATRRAEASHVGVPIEALLDDEGWRAVWALIDELESERPHVLGGFGDEDEAAVALLERVEAHPNVASAGELASGLEEMQLNAPSLLVTVPLANVDMPRGFVALDDGLALVPTWDPDSDGLVVRADEYPNDPQTQLERHFRDRPGRGSRRERDEQTGERIDTRAMVSLVSVEHGPRRRAVVRAETRARYALAVWTLLAPPPEDPTMTTMWPTLATWIPQPTMHEFAEVKEHRPGTPPAEQDRPRGGTYIYGGWPLPDKEVLLAPFKAIEVADAGGHHAGALLSTARALYLAAEPTAGLSAIERLVQVRIAMEALSERPPQGERGARFDRIADRLGVWDTLRADYGEQTVVRAQERLNVWRTLAVHRSHGFRAHWGFQRGEILRGQGTDQSADELNPAVARRDLQIAYAAAQIVAAAVFWIAHDCGFEDSFVEPLFCA
jgi:hypothetical protein